MPIESFLQKTAIPMENLTSIEFSKENKIEGCVHLLGHFS